MTSSPGSSAVTYQSTKNSRGRRRGAGPRGRRSRSRRRRRPAPAGSRGRVGERDRAADRAHVAHGRVGDLRGRMRAPRAAVPRSSALAAVSRWRVKAPMRRPPSACARMPRSSSMPARLTSAAARARARSSSPPASRRRRAAWRPDRPPAARPPRRRCAARECLQRGRHAWPVEAAAEAVRAATARSVATTTARDARRADGAGAAADGGRRDSAPRACQFASSCALQVRANSSPRLCAFFFIMPSAKRPSRPVTATSER